MPPATITITITSTAIAVAVHDRGPGFARLPAVPGGRQEDAMRHTGPPAAYPAPPNPEQLNGRGMWLARHLCDRLDLHTNVDGTTVTLTLYR